VRQLRRTQLHPVHDRIGVTPEADRIDECQAAHAPRVRRRQLARDHAAERVSDDQRFFDLQSRQQLVVAEDQIPEAVEPIDVVVRLRRRPWMLRRINSEAPRQIVENRTPREPKRAVEKAQRRPGARRQHAHANTAVPDGYRLLAVHAYYPPTAAGTDSPTWSRSCSAHHYLPPPS